MRKLICMKRGQQLDICCCCTSGEIAFLLTPCAKKTDCQQLAICNIHLRDNHLSDTKCPRTCVYWLRMCVCVKNICRRLRSSPPPPATSPPFTNMHIYTAVHMYVQLVYYSASWQEEAFAILYIAMAKSALSPQM